MSYFRKEDTRAAVVIAVLFVLITGGLTLFLVLRPEDSRPSLTPAQLREAERLQAALRADSLSRWKRESEEKLNAKPFPFDPNRADSATLRAVGLSERQASNILKYRRKGGKWRSPDDFARLYGLSRESFLRLRPFIRIAPESRRDEEPAYYGTPKGDVQAFEKVEKWAEGTILSLNEADTTALKKIPGIGSWYASRIVRYRERLGGFISTAQLSEIEGLPAGISRWFEIKPQPAVKRIEAQPSGFQNARSPSLSQLRTGLHHRQPPQEIRTDYGMGRPEPL